MKHAYKLSIVLISLLSSASFSATKTEETVEEIEGISRYILEASSVVIEGQSAIDLYNALNDKTITYPGNKTAIKSKNNVICTAEILTAQGEGEFIADASCIIRLSSSTVANQ